MPHQWRTPLCLYNVHANPSTSAEFGSQESNGCMHPQRAKHRYYSKQFRAQTALVLRSAAISSPWDCPLLESYNVPDILRLWLAAAVGQQGRMPKPPGCSSAQDKDQFIFSTWVRSLHVCQAVFIIGYECRSQWLGAYTEWRSWPHNLCKMSFRSTCTVHVVFLGMTISSLTAHIRYTKLWSIPGLQVLLLATYQSKGMPVYSPYPNARFRFCMHCVAAPLKRLSKPPTTTTRSPSLWT